MPSCLLLALLVPPCAAWLPQGGGGVSRRAVLAAGPAALAATPLAASAKSKEAAKSKAIQKATAAEARQAMKEYKLAPRPELVGNAESGYSYKTGTVKAGSTGELTDYFTTKGATIQEDYRATKSRATTLSAADAAKPAPRAASSAPPPPKKAKAELSEDEQKVLSKRKEMAGMRDDMGRLIF